MIPKIPPRYHSYTLRLWEERGSPDREETEWRFLLVDSSSGERRGFNSLMNLMDYLQQEMSGEAPE